MDLEKLGQAVSILRKYGNDKLEVKYADYSKESIFQAEEYIALSKAKDVSKAHTELLNGLGVEFYRGSWRFFL